MNAEQSRAPGSGAGDALSAACRFNAGASERSRPLWPGMNAALTVSGRKHARVMKRFGLVRSSRGSGPDARKQEMLYVNIAAYIINNVNNVSVGQI